MPEPFMRAPLAEAHRPPGECLSATMKHGPTPEGGRQPHRWLALDVHQIEEDGPLFWTPDLRSVSFTIPRVALRLICGACGQAHLLDLPRGAVLVLRDGVLHIEGGET